MKYLLQQPKKLECMAIVKLGQWMAVKVTKLMPLSLPRQSDATKAELLLSRQIELIRKFIDRNVPKMLHNKFVFEAIRELSQLFYRIEHSEKCSSQLNVISRMLETLLTENLTCISLNSKQMKQFGSSLYLKSHMLKSVTDLTVELKPGIHDSSIREIQVIQLLKELDNLKCLSIDYCTDNILRCLTMNCKLIEKLNLNNSNINDNNIEILTELSNLKSIYLYATAVSQKGIEILLKFCTNIEHIDTDTNFVACAIEQIVSYKENAGTQFRLKSYVNDSETTKKQLQLVILKCPLIQKVMFTKYQFSQSYLMILNDLKDLSELKLAGYSFSTDQIKEVLQIRGRNLVHLHLQKVDQIDINALMLVSQMCPNLQSLIIEKCNYVKQTLLTVESNFSNRENTVLCPSFNNLKTLSVGVNGGWPPTEELLLFLLSNCPNVEFVHVRGKLISQIISKVLDNNPLNCLKELRIWMCDNSVLSMLVIERILQNCINFPEILIH